MKRSAVKTIRTTLRVYPVLGIGRHYSVKIECTNGKGKLVEPTTYIHFGSLEEQGDTFEFNEVGFLNGNDFVGPRHLDERFADRLADRFAGPVSELQIDQMRAELKTCRKPFAQKSRMFKDSEIDVLLGPDGELGPKDSGLVAYYTPKQWKKVLDREKEYDQALVRSRVPYNFMTTNSTSAMRTYLGEVLNWPLDTVQKSFSRMVFAFRLGWRYKFEWEPSDPNPLTHPISYNGKPIKRRKKVDPWFRGKPTVLTSK